MTKRVFFIDDDAEDAGIFTDAISELSYDIIVDHFDNGYRALEKLVQPNNAEIPDIIFLDINMPLLNGWECLREIKKLSSAQQIPVIMYSTADFQDIGINATDIGATAFITKPNTYPELKVRLQELFNSIFP